MSSIYNTEPQPTASVIIHTNHGELLVEIFAKQTPLTSRNFLQLCLDGYYDNTVFRRLVPGFILQGGDPTGTGNGGESIFDAGALSGDLDPWPMEERRGRNAGPTGSNFKDEFHSRLKFNRRGLLGMANDGTVDSNGSQFFFTLDKAEELTGKNTMFGRIEGNTIYNLAKMGEAEVEEGTERPLYPTKVTRTEVLVNPFDGMEKRERVARRIDKPVTSEKKPKKRKGGKQLLSFGDEEADSVPTPVLKKAKFDTRVVLDVAGVEDEAPKTAQAKGRSKKESKAAKKSTRSVTNSLQEAEDDDIAPPPLKSPQSYSKPVRVSIKNGDESSPELEAPRGKTALERTNEEIAALKASMKRLVHQEPAVEKKKSALEQMIPETATRGRKRQPGGSNLSAREEQSTMRLLKAFQSKLEQAPADKDTASANIEQGEDNDASNIADEGDVCDLHFIANCQSCQNWAKLEGKEESDDEGWLSHTLSFAADKLGKDLSYRKKAEEELIVIDPLAKARTLKEEKRMEREARSKGTGREWDQVRNARMANASALSGRGAK